MIKRSRRSISRDRIDIQYSDFEILFLLHLTSLIQRLIARSDRTAVSEDVFDTVQLFMRRKF